jgi:hypothetical protein
MLFIYEDGTVERVVEMEEWFYWFNYPGAGLNPHPGETHP